MKYFDIMKVFSQIVAEKLNEHCVIDTEFMRGTQGEIAKIDYVDLAALSVRPNHRYRILLEEQTEYNVDCAHKIEKIVLSIRYYDVVKNKTTLWNDAGEVVFCKTYYKIDKDYYVCNRQELEDVFELRRSRRKAKYNFDEDIVKPVNEDKYNELASKYVKHKVYRFANNVRLVKESRGRYFVSYKKKNGQDTAVTLYLKRV